MSGAAIQEEVSLWTYLNVLLRRRRFLFALPVVLAVAVGTWSLVWPREYTASASFIQQESGVQQSQLGQLASQFGLTVKAASTSAPQFYADLLQTRDVLREVATTTYHLSGSDPFTGDLIAYLRIRKPDRDAAIAQAVKALRRIVTVSTDRVTGLVRFQVDTRSRELSAQIANRLLELLNDYNLRRRQTQARAEREFVEQRLAEVKNDLTSAEEALAGFLARNRRYADSPQLAAEEQRLQRQVSLRQQVYLSLAQSYEAAKVEEVRNTPLITVVDRPDGFVEPKPRGTVRNMVLALFAGVFIALGVAFFLEYVAGQRQEGSAGYQEFVALRQALLADLRKGPFRRGGR